MYDVTTAKLFLLDMDGTFYLDDTLLPTARTADITDLICNTAGALVGYGLYRPWKKHLHAWM